ncbi:hypothetical protein EGW08_013896 [Elysia chlorotica]|uniref:DUF19 domain-containing protein n=1 Tax=Elysia chlorotica TaxID=188477 RepID=A0A433T9U2_ELYCH|nr:hypothetical protein EGW08_013896 [Elysia chlorotica]
MDYSVKVAVLILLLAVIDASTSSVIKRDFDEGQEEENNSSKCMDKKSENCVKPNLEQYDSVFSNIQTAGEFISIRSNLERWSSSFQEAKICMQREMAEPYCSGVTEKQTFDIEVEFYSGYLASPENVDILVNLSTSDCFNNSSLLESAEQEFYSCMPLLYGVSYDQEADLCQAVDNTRECIVYSGSHWCGSVAGDFVGSVWDYLVHTESGREYKDNYTATYFSNMDYSVKVAVLILLLAIIDASTSSVIKRGFDEGQEEENNSSKCMDKKSENCVKPNLEQYDSVFSNIQTAGEFISIRSNLERWSSSFQEAKICMQREMAEPYCSGVTEKQTFDIEVEFYSGYLASPENMDILVNLSTSDCFKNSSLLESAEQEFYSCMPLLYGVSYDQEADLCQAVDNTRECIVYSGSHWCGSVAGDFVGSVWDYLVHTESGRNLSVATSIIKLICL